MGLLLFVAIPIPFTGAWTGSLIAYLFNLNFLKSLVTIFFGVLIAAGSMILVTLTGIDILLVFVGFVIIGVIMSILMFVSMFKSAV